MMASVAPAESGVMDSPWAHGWDTAGQAWWGDFGYSLLDGEQAAFIADNYFLASLEKCTGKSAGLFSEQAIYETAAQLKSLNATVKTTFYWHTGQAGISCYAAQEDFLRHPECTPWNPGILDAWRSASSATHAGPVLGQGC